MLFHNVFVFVCNDLYHVVSEDGAADDETLADFDAIYSCIDVDCVCAENWETPHINVVENSKIENSIRLTYRQEQVSQLNGNDDRGKPLVCNEDGNAGHCGHYELIAPLDVENVVNESQEDHHTDGEEPCILQVRFL